MEIRNLAVDDQGVYEFKAGNQSSSSHVTVQGASITKPLHDKNVLETENVTLECEVVTTGVKGVWKRNGVEINFDTQDCKDVYNVNGHRHQLILKDIDQDHAGSYTFEVGTAKSTCHVDVEGMPYQTLYCL